MCSAGYVASFPTTPSIYSRSVAWKIDSAAREERGNGHIVADAIARRGAIVRAFNAHTQAVGEYIAKIWSDFIVRLKLAQRSAFCAKRVPKRCYCGWEGFSGALNATASRVGIAERPAVVAFQRRTSRYTAQRGRQSSQTRVS